MTQLLKKSAYYIFLVIGCGIPLAATIFLSQSATGISSATAEDAQPPAAIQNQNQENNIPSTANFEIRTAANSNLPFDELELQTIQENIQLYASATLLAEIESVVLHQQFIAVTIVKQSNPSIRRTAILDADINQLEVQLTRLELVLRGFDFSTIDEEIVEIDVRYRLPVLRSTPTL